MISVAGKNCDLAFAVFDKELQNSSFLDSYIRMEYVNDLKTCAAINPEKELAYTQKGVELLKEGLQIQPLYTRYWLYLGSFNTVLALNETDQNKKSDLIKEAYADFAKALTLAPLHIEILEEQTKTDTVPEITKK